MSEICKRVELGVLCIRHFIDRRTERNKPTFDYSSLQPRRKLPYPSIWMKSLSVLKPWPSHLAARYDSFE